MDNAFETRRQYASIKTQVESVRVLVEEIDELCKKISTRFLETVSDLTLEEVKSKYSDSYFADLYFEDGELWTLGKKFGQGMSELRSVLDYLVRFLVYVNKKSPDRRSEFLILDDNTKKLPDRNEFLSEKSLDGLTLDQKIEIYSMQPVGTRMDWRAETLSAVNFHRNTFMHNAIPFVVPYFVPHFSSKDRLRMNKKRGVYVDSDPSSKIKRVGFEVLVYKEDLWRLKKMMLRSQLYGKPAELLKKHRKTIIGIMQMLTRDVSADFDFKFFNAPYQFDD